MSDQLSPTTPGAGLPPQGFATSPPGGQPRGFKRSASSEDDDFQNGDADGSRPASARRNIAVKRACNECRQQKVSVGQEKKTPTDHPTDCECSSSAMSSAIPL
jgi:hypothetical protein